MTHVPAPDAPAPAESPRRLLSARQAEIVDRLVEAAADEARACGYDGMSVRSAARRAGVAPATAYTYFGSKDHLLAELLWRRVRSLSLASSDDPRPPVERVTATLGELALFVADDPEVAAACTVALLGTGPDVRALRARVGAEMHERVVAALGERADPAVVRAIDFAYFGAMLAAGMGHVRFEELPEALAEVAALVVGSGA